MKRTMLNSAIATAILLCLLPVANVSIAKPSTDPAPITEQELVRRTQSLFDSLVSGDREPWIKYFADDAIYFDEKGRNMNKAALIADLKPLPAGYSGTIQIRNVQSRFLRDTVILSYDLAETETIFEQNLAARYHETDTWIHRGDSWQITAAQAFRYYEDPAAGEIDLATLPRFTGTYQLAPGQIRHLTVDGGKLFLERNGKREELLPESCDIFFRKGVEGRVLLHATHGRVDALIDRRNNEDVIWRRTD